MSLSPPYAFGWVAEPAEVEAVLGQLPVPLFADTPAAQSAAEGDLFLWEACRRVVGDLLPPRQQGAVGSCVGFGTASAIEHLMCVEIVAGDPEAYHDLAPEVIYGGSRVQVGGGRLGGADGSLGAWAAAFVSRWGVVARGVHGRLDLTAYDESQCRALGRQGLPTELEALARNHPVRTVALVRSWNEARAAITSGYPIAVCSLQGFTMERDRDGFARPRGTWPHCMALVGVQAGRRPGGFLLNSWGGQVHTGPSGVGDPSPAGFWADADVLDRMLRQGDSWAFSAFEGFPARRLDWLI